MRFRSTPNSGITAVTGQRSRQWVREHVVLQAEQSGIMHKYTYCALLWNRAANGI